MGTNPHFRLAVAAISDGLKAWEILKKRHHNIDLILTELDLPSISGYALLTLIMEHDSCKDIPVISVSHALTFFFSLLLDSPLLSLPLHPINLFFCLFILAVMSSQDSISTVLKCVLKGAADFLIKPVRKNELKNLWRHVWRRLDVCHLSFHVFIFRFYEYFL